MNLKNSAKEFAIQAHMGQVRKNEIDKPMIMHPISVGTILEKYGYDEEIIAAGYLHDVVEDTKYTIYDIKEKFGEVVANLVMGASESDKTLSWEERKQSTIEKTKTLPLKNKLVICADKIDNLEDIMIKFQKTGIRDFSLFKRGEEKQKWYYTSMYESLIYNEDETLPIFCELKNILDIVFYNKEDLYLKDVIFNNNKTYYEKLKKLHAQKMELQKLKRLCTLKSDFVIEFSGTPRTGKTSVINNLYDFFKKGGFNVKKIEEFTTSKYYKNYFRPEHKNKNTEEINELIIKEITEQLLSELASNNEIILIDRSINDRIIWNYIRYKKGEMSKELYNKLKNEYSKLSKKIIDCLVITYTDSLTSLKRDYNNSLALEYRSFLNVKNIEEYNDSLNNLKKLFLTSVDSFNLIDTTDITVNDTSIEVASQIMPLIRKKYINNFKKEYNLK